MLHKCMFYVAGGVSMLPSYETGIYLKILNKVNSIEEIHDILDNRQYLKDISHESVKPTAQPHTHSVPRAEES